MRTLARTIFAVTQTILITCTVVACSPDACGCVAPTAGSIAYILGAHANGPATATPDIVDTAVDGQAKLTVVEADGKPTVAISVDLTSKANSDDARAHEVRERKADLRTRLSAVRPTTAEVDLLAAIDLGARSLQREPKLMVVESPGLPTAGGLSFTSRGMLMADADEVAADLERKKQLPELEGVRVRLRGLGDTTAPQSPLSIAERRNLVAIWTAVLTKAGAVVDPDDKPRTGPTWTDAPPVATVPVATPTGGTALPTPEKTQPLPTTAFFAADSAVLLDRPGAVEALRPFEEHLRTAGGRIDLIGTTARVGDKEGQISLSTDRAKALRSVLVSDLHVPEDRVSADGLGSYYPEYVDDHDAQGNLLPDKAALNRTVRVTVRA